jgi:trehalose utilization protein
LIRELQARTATLQAAARLPEHVLAQTDVLSSWRRAAHRQVDDPIVHRVQQRVLEGMGIGAQHGRWPARGSRCRARSLPTHYDERVAAVAAQRGALGTADSRLVLGPTTMVARRHDR